jgi:hypothetical protein
LAIKRWEEVVAQWKTEPDRSIPLSLSFRTVTSNAESQETPAALLRSAGLAIYEHKRRKKCLAGKIVEL